jgi:hypothetical protein
VDYVHTKIKGIFLNGYLLNFFFLSRFDIEQTTHAAVLNILATLELLAAPVVISEVGKFN